MEITATSDLGFKSLSRMQHLLCAIFPAAADIAKGHITYMNPGNHLACVLFPKFKNLVDETDEAAYKAKQKAVEEAQQNSLKAEEKKTAEQRRTYDRIAEDISLQNKKDALCLTMLPVLINAFVRQEPMKLTYKKRAINSEGTLSSPETTEEIYVTQQNISDAIARKKELIPYCPEIFNTALQFCSRFIIDKEKALSEKQHLSVVVAELIKAGADPLKSFQCPANSNAFLESIKNHLFKDAMQMLNSPNFNIPKDQMDTYFQRIDKEYRNLTDKRRPTRLSTDAKEAKECIELGQNLLSLFVSAEDDYTYKSVKGLDPQIVWKQTGTVLSQKLNGEMAGMYSQFVASELKATRLMILAARRIIQANNQQAIKNVCRKYGCLDSLHLDSDHSER